MSDILSGLTAHLLLDSALFALVGARVFPEKLPAGTTENPTIMPALTYQLIDEPVFTTHGNQQLFNARIQIDCWGGSYKSAQTVAALLHASLHGYRGAMGTITVGGVFRKSKRDDPNPDIELYRVSQDFVFNYS